MTIEAMQRCGGCRRHLAAHEDACPFCHAKVGLTLGTSALIVAMSAMLGACTDRVAGGGQDSGAGSESGSSSATSGDSDPSVSASASTTMPTSAEATTFDTGDRPTTTTDADTSTSTIETDSISAGFIYGSADGGGVSIECSIWAQDCPEGEKCVPWDNEGGANWNATRCSPVDPNAHGVGEPCTVEGSEQSGLDDCALGAVCFDVDAQTLEGTCVAQCGGSEAQPECAGETACLISGEVLNLCLPTCLPLTPACAGAQICIPWSDDFLCVPDASGDEGQYGDGCEYVNACDAGLFCASARAVLGCDTIGCCSDFCDVSLANPDEQCTGVADGQQCTAWYADGEAPPGYENLGACTIPA